MFQNHHRNNIFWLIVVVVVPVLSSLSKLFVSNCHHQAELNFSEMSVFVISVMYAGGDIDRGRMKDGTGTNIQWLLPCMAIHETNFIKVKKIHVIDHASCIVK